MLDAIQPYRGRGRGRGSRGSARGSSRDVRHGRSSGPVATERGDAADERVVADFTAGTFFFYLECFCLLLLPCFRLCKFTYSLDFFLFLRQREKQRLKVERKMVFLKLKFHMSSQSGVDVATKSQGCQVSTTCWIICLLLGRLISQLVFSFDCGFDG